MRSRTERPLSWKPRLMHGFACFLIAIPSLLCAQTRRAPETEFNWDLYESMMTAYCSNLNVLAQDTRQSTSNYVGMMMPEMSPSAMSIQSQPPFDASKFPAEFTSGLVSQTVEGITYYPLTVYADTNSDQCLFFNAQTQSIGYVSADGTYHSEAQEYAPTNVLIRYDMLSEADLIKLAWRYPVETGGATWTEPGPPTGSVAHLCFSGIQRTNTVIKLFVAYPTDFHTYCTNLDIYVSGDLQSGWWTLAGTTVVNAATNWVSWTNTNAAVFLRLLHAAGNADRDGDGDGFADARERYLYHTDPSNSASFPAMASGTVTYTGRQSGAVCVLATTLSNNWTAGPFVRIPQPGSFTNLGVTTGTSQWFRAYMDSNGNMSRDYWEASGVSIASPLLVTGTVINISIILSDPDTDSDGLPDWWELQQTGSLTNLTGNGDNDKDGFANSNEYAYACNPRVGDTDGDGMGDWAEWVNGQNPTNWDNYSRLPFHESFDVVKYQKLMANGATNFGYSVAVWSNTLVAGAPDLSGRTTNGAAYVFAWNGTTWTQQQRLVAWAGQTNDSFGISVGISSNVIIVGAENADSRGAAYIFRWSGTEWTNEWKLYDVALSDGSCFGSAVAVEGSSVVVGAKNWRDYSYVSYCYKGRAYLFKRDGSVWSNSAVANGYFSGSNEGLWSGHMGSSVALKGPRAVFGGSGQAGDWGHAETYSITGAGWSSETSCLRPYDTRDDDRFGTAVSLGTDRMLVSAPQQYPTGKGYIFKPMGSNWNYEAVLTASDSEGLTSFGISAAIGEDVAALGADQADDGRTVDPGAVYLFRRFGTLWEEWGNIRLAALPAGSRLGHAVAICNDTLIAGAYGEHGNSNSGAVYVFSVSNALACGGADGGMSLDGRKGWVTASEFMLVQTDVVHQTTGALQISSSFGHAELSHTIAAHGISNVWIDSWARFIPSNATARADHPDVADFDESTTAAFGVNQSGQLVAYDGGGTGTWSTASNFTVTASDFHRYSIRQDYVARQWDLYFDGSIVFAALGFAHTNATEFSRFSFAAQWECMTYLDSIAVSTNAPQW